MRRFLFLSLLAICALVASAAKKTIRVRANSAESFLQAIAEANSADSSDIVTIEIPEGTYDLGKKVLTTLTANNATVRGAGMRKTIIRNAPDTKDEGISKTATLRLIGENITIEDLTLENALEYYNDNFAGRAVSLQDKGTRTICRRVCLMSHQDTYYCQRNDGQYFFDECEIHGTVDYICGAGDVFFNNCRLVVEKRKADGSGFCTIAAPNDSKNFGFVFYNCTIENHAQGYNLARSWNGKSRCAFVNTVHLSPEAVSKTRYQAKGMNVLPTSFVEINSRDGKGNVVSPKSNVVNFFLKQDTVSMETILPSKDARKYSLKKVFANWKEAR